MKNLKYIILVLSAVVVQSCFTAKNYQRPQEQVFNEQYFRTDQLPQDSLSMAEFSWKEIFTDTYLTQYIDKALANNLDIKMALKNIDIAQAYLNQGKAAYFPTLNAGINYTGSTPSLNSQTGINLESRDYFNQIDLSGNLSWEADIWGKIRSGQRAANASYLQTVSAHQAVKSEIVAAIASAYYQLLALDEQMRITQETITNREESLTTIKLLKDAGNVTEVAVQQTEAQLYNAQALLLDINNQIKLLENVFSVLMGENPQTIARSNLSEQQITVDLKTGIPVELLSNRPDVMAAEYGLINAFELTNVARSNFYPSLRLGASGGIQSMEFDKLFSANSLFATILGSLTQPIFNGRQIKTQYEASQAHQEIALLNYKKTILNASKDVSDAVYTYQTNLEREAIKQKEYEAYQNATQYSEELLTYGMATYLDVLISKEAALNARLSVINSKFGKLNAIIQLYKAVGGGWR